MPQEVSVSYQAIKSKVYRWSAALVVAEKNEADIQESIRRWWDLIHPADRPIAQKYLLPVLGHSSAPLEALGDGLMSRPNNSDALCAVIPSRRLKLAERFVKETSMRATV